MRLTKALLIAALVPGAAPAQDAMTPGAGMNHAAMTPGTAMTHAAMTGAAAMPPAAMPTEPGQGGFGTVAEIVAMLRADPATDWAAVDIAALVAHLRDMDALFTEAAPETEAVPGGAAFRFRRDAKGADAVWRMVPAHGPVLTGETGWASDVDATGDTLVWTVTGDEAQIRALGFMGLMAVGNHHQAHHLALARGTGM